MFVTDKYSDIKTKKLKITKLDINKPENNNSENDINKNDKEFLLNYKNPKIKHSSNKCDYDEPILFETRKCLFPIK